MRKFLLPALAAGLALAAASAASAQIVHINPNKAFISSAVTVPAGSDTIYVSGITPDPLDKAKPTEYGDAKAQTISILTKIEAILKGAGYTFSDAVMMRVLLVGDPANGGKMDFAGMNAGYTQFFGGLENKPARITSQIVALAGPFNVEIELQAAKTPKKS